MLYKENSFKKELVKSANSKYYVYFFYCKECNNEIKAQSSQLKRHSGKCMSCAQKKRPYEYILSELYQRYKTKRGLEVTITYDDLIEIINNPECHYCGEILLYNKHTRNELKEHNTRAYQLDRKDNNKGYTKDNVVPCCWTCNRLKSNVFSFEEFMMLAPTIKDIKIKRKNNA